MNNKIYYLLATQDTNMGDLLINKMLVDEVSKYGDVYIDSVGISEEFSKFLFDKKNIYSANNYLGASLKRASFFKVLLSSKKFNYFFRTPGPNGRITSFKGFIVQSYFSFFLTVLRLNKLKLYQVGTDFATETFIENLNGKYNSRILSGCYIRSKEDVSVISNKGFKKVGYIPDLAFLYKPNKIAQNKTKVLVSFRDLKDEKYAERISSFLESNLPRLIEKGLQVIFFSQVEADKEFNALLFEKFRSDNVSLMPNCIWYDEIEGLYFDAKYTISNRLHVLLLGFVHEALPIAVLNSDSKTSKIYKIFASFNMADSFLNPKNAYEHNYEDLRLKIRTVNKENLGICQETIKLMFS